MSPDHALRPAPRARKARSKAVTDPYNPYSAPQAGTPSPVGPDGAWAPGQPQPWTAGEVLSLAWDRVKAHWGVLVGAQFILLIIGSVPGVITNVIMITAHVTQWSPEHFGLLGGNYLVSLVVQSFFLPGMLRMVLDAARGRAPELGTLFSGGDRFLPIVAASLLVYVLTLLGCAILIVPGVFLMIGLLFVPLFVTDAKLGPVAAIKASWQATSGHRVEVFLLVLASFGLIFLGLIMCCFGILLTLPIYWTALAIAYTRITGTAGPAPQGPPAYPPLPGGFQAPGYPPYPPPQGPPGYPPR
jgi:hypothetical protein